MFFTIPLRNAPSLCGSRRLNFTPMMEKRIRGTFGVHSARPSRFTPHGMTPVPVLPQVRLPQLLLAGGREGGPRHSRPSALPPGLACQRCTVDEANRVLRQAQADQQPAG